MKLEVGMYVRTNRGDITKISKILENERVFFEDKVDIDYFTSDSFGISYLKECKASHNLLGNDKEPCLIEIGDYVNGFPVIHKENDILKCGLLVQFKENEIKSIVTKEQFESMSYKVGE